MSIVPILVVIFVVFLIFRKKNTNKIEENENIRKQTVKEIVKDNKNFLREEYKIQQEKDFEKQDRMTDSLLKRQDKQLKILEQARKKIETGNLEEGIAIIEDITYNQGGIIFPGISWPMYLADVLYKNKMYDRCWKYLNYISLTHLDCLPKIKKLQSKICSKEKKYNDAFYFYIMSVVYSYQGSSFKPTMEIIEMKMNKNMSKVKIKISNEELFQRILNYINNQSSEIEIRDDLRKIIV